jgi:hypothetical protein
MEAPVAEARMTPLAALKGGDTESNGGSMLQTSCCLFPFPSFRVVALDTFSDPTRCCFHPADGRIQGRAVRAGGIIR